MDNMNSSTLVATLIDAVAAHIKAQLTPALSRMVDDKIAEANTSGIAAAAALDVEQFSGVIVTAIENDSAVQDSIADIVREVLERGGAGDLSDHREFRDLESQVSDLDSRLGEVESYDNRLDALESQVGTLTDAIESRTEFMTPRGDVHPEFEAAVKRVLRDMAA